MESDWQEINQKQLLPSLHDEHGQPPHNNIGSIAFDTHQELLWVGDNHGFVSSYYEAALTRYTSWQAHPADDGSVKQFLFDAKCVYSVTSQSLHCMLRRGITQWHTQHPSMKDMSCMTFIERGSIILIAGKQGSILKVNAINGQIVEEIPSTARYCMMKHCNRHICAAAFSGSVDILDSVTLEVQKHWPGQSSTFSSIDAKNEFLITCGWALRNYGGSLSRQAPEPLAKVFDLRLMEQAVPISFPAGASFVQIHPRMQTTCVIANTHGQIQVADMMNPNGSQLKFLNIEIADFVMSPSGNVWIIADDQNCLHVWADPSKLSFNEHSETTSFADKTASVPYMSIDADLPLGMVGMPYYKDNLLSAWGSDHVYESVKVAPEIDPDVERSLRPNRFGLGRIAPNNGGSYRNQGTAMSTRATRPNGMPSQLNGEEIKDVLGLYANVQIIYGNYGIKDFDFQLHNKTKFSGLEADIEDSYLNPLLQLLKYTPSIRNVALAHVASKCLDVQCLLCEMGFLFDMLEKAEGVVCRATNFLNTYKSLVFAKNLSERTLDTTLAEATEAMLPRLINESFKTPLGRGVEDLNLTLTSNAQVTLRCLKSDHGSDHVGKTQSFQILSLVYPRSTDISKRPVTFSDLLASSVSAESKMQGYCPNCRSYPQLKSKRRFVELPPVLTVNAIPDMNRETSFRVWSTPGFLPERVGLYIDQTGEVGCVERNIESVCGEFGIYELVGFVVQIYNKKDRKSHLVSIVNVALSRSGSSDSHWHLFNDFSVQEVDSKEALHFDPSWKTPVLLIYQDKAYRGNNNSWKNALDTNCLSDWGSMNSNQGSPLQAYEEIVPDLHLAIDAEFVRLQNEEISIDVDGKRTTIRPARLTPGRVSALRVGGDQDSLPFMDDYIHVSEPIVNYDTKYSGLEIGDLEYGRSPYHLQALKTVYKKLWLLLNLGCTFIGHNLDSDFRVLNIFVPYAQVIDTVKLFRRPEAKRFLSLRFLAWHFLKDEIQTGNHDSIVDAQTALRLWRKYQEYEDAGVVNQVLKELYREGEKTQFLPGPEYEAKKRGSRGVGLLEPNAPPSSGRVTPDLAGARGGSVAGSAPVTPDGRSRARQGAYFESPLR